MLTYEYECKGCGKHFEVQQGMTETPVAQCPECGGESRRLISGGSGFILKSRDPVRDGEYGSSCSLEERGKTCCGRDEQCGTPACGSRK